MATPAGELMFVPHCGRCADRAGERPFRHGRLRCVMAGFSSATLVAVLALSLAPVSAADTTDLRSLVDGARGGCPPLQWDPVLVDVAQRATDESQSYVNHTARFEPFEDPMPLLRSLGYNAGKAKLLVGYGDVEAKATHGVILQGWQAIPDCTYTRYGVNVLDQQAGGLDHDGGGYALTAVVLAGD
jgi:hypothetical protein